MPATFDPSLSTPKDHLRLALGDTDLENPLLVDETILAKLSFGYLVALAQLADALAIKAAQDPSHYGEGPGGLSVDWAERVRAWQQLSKDVRKGRIADPQGGERPGAAIAELGIPNPKELRTQ